MKTIIAAAVALGLSVPAWADLTVSFYEGAPKDRFEIVYSGACPLKNAVIEIDLGASAAGLILDTTRRGAGVSVFQPLEFVSGRENLNAAPEATDGDTRIRLAVDALVSGEKIVFTTDVDDTKGTGPTMISGAEISGAEVALEQNDQRSRVVFDTSATATIATNTCNA